MKEQKKKHLKNLSKKREYEYSYPTQPSGILNPTDPDPHGFFLPARIEDLELKL